MIKHYFLIALRNLKRQKALATINILGLSIGLACFILFLLYAVNEFNFDRFHQNADNIYRVYRWTEAMEGEDASGDIYLPMPLGPALKQDLTDVEDYVRMQEGWSATYLRTGGRVTSLPVSFADPSMFSVFSFPLKYGEPKTALEGIHSLVLSEETAIQLFGNRNPIGEKVEIKLFDEFEPFVVSAVAKHIPSNSSLRFDVLGNYEYLPTTKNGKRSVNNWNRSSYFTFVKLKPGSTLATDEARLRAFRKKYYPTEEDEYRKAGYWKEKGVPVKYGMQPLLTIHTDTKIWGGSIPAVDPKIIWILLGIAGAVLLIACINFTTLAIGRSAIRAREIGIRKVVGSMRKQLITQFLAEAILLTIFSVLLGLALSKILLPYFNQLSGRILDFSFRQFPEMYWLLIGLTLLVGLLAGSYPALILSRFNPIEVLKQKIKVGGSNIFTKSLVTFQFVLSIGLVASMIVILQQINFMNSKNPGFNKENIVMIDGSNTDAAKIYPIFKQAMSSNPQVVSMSSAELGLGEGTGWSRSGFDYKGRHKEVFEYFVDADYVPTLGIQMIRGRNFDPHIASDTLTSVIVNEKMVSDMGWTLDNAVGQPLTGYMEKLTPVVIGVVKDFNFRPLKVEIEPQMFHQFSDYKPFKYFVRLKPGNPSKTLAEMEKVWNGLERDIPFKYSFLDENIARFYESEQRWGKIVGWAGGISIFLACLGLFGLAALAAVNRTKEIGIRKVLGASLGTIVGLLSKDFLKLVLIALVIAAPVSWYFMDKWLQDFAYRISIGWYIFVLAGFLAVLIAFLTIGFQAIKAGIKNPVAALRSE